MTAPIVTLLTDFGLQDGYVGAMKGVLLTRCPRVHLVDLTHEIPPGAIDTGAYVLWQATSEKLPTGRVNDWPYQGVCSSPMVDGERLYYVTNRCEVVCLDTEGFRDDENDGPFDGETLTSERDGDIVWKYDMMEELR